MCRICVLNLSGYYFFPVLIKLSVTLFATFFPSFLKKERNQRGGIHHGLCSDWILLQHLRFNIILRIIIWEYLVVHFSGLTGFNLLFNIS